MKSISRFALIITMAVILSATVFGAATPGVNLLTGTTEVQTFDNLTSLPENIENAELSDSPFAGESGKVLHANQKNATYSTIMFNFDPALDCDRPYRIAFNIYKKADEGYGTDSTQLWIMKNGTSSWQIAKNIGGLAPNNSDGWYEYDYLVATFGTLTNKNTGEIDTSDISTIRIEWKYDSTTSCLTNENVYVDDVSIIPSYKFTYLDEDGETVIKTSYEDTIETTFTPFVSADEQNDGIIGWSLQNDGTADETISLNNEDVTLYAVYDNTLKINLSADKTLLVEEGDTAMLSTNLWHRNGTDGITVTYSVAEGSSYVTLGDNGDGTATVVAKGEGLAKILCSSSTGESEYIYILCDYQTVETEEVVQTVPTISENEWIYDHANTVYDETEGAWKVYKATDLVKTDDGAGNVTYYTNGFLSKSQSVDTSVYKYLLFRVKADRATSFQIRMNKSGTYYSATYPTVSATDGEYVDVAVDIATAVSSATISQWVLGVTNHNDVVYIKDITLSNISTYEPEIPEVKAVKVIKSVASLEGDSATEVAEAAAFSNKSSSGNVAWKSSSECIAVKNNGDGTATLKAMSDGTATITAYYEGDETVAESFDVTVTGQREKQAVYDIRILFWGASTTKHAPSSSLGWTGNWGMAASAEENDYVHKLVSYLEEKYYPSTVTYEVVASSAWDTSLATETDASKDWTNHEQYTEIEAVIKDLKPNIIVTAMTGNMGTATELDVAYNAYKQMYDMMYTYCPDAIVVAQHCGLSCVSRNDQMYALLDADYSDKIFHVYHVNPTMKLDSSNYATEYASINSGVAAHWGDKGHNLVASTCFDLIYPEVPANIEAEYIYIPEDIEITGDTIVDEKGESLWLGVSVTPDDASCDVVWSVDNSNIAIVSKNGLLTPLANGTVVVTVTSAYDDSVFDTHTVTITNQLENYTLTYAPGTTDEVTGLPAADEYASGEYTLSSAIPLRDAYTFIGWGLSENAEEAVSSVNITGETTVYALWKKTDGFEFEGEYDENNGFIYGFEIESGFHNNIKDSCLYTTCTAGAKVTFISPVLDIEAETLSIGMTCNYTDEAGAVVVTVKYSDKEKVFTYPLTSTMSTTYVADLSDINSAVTGVEIFVDSIPEDSSMYDIGIDFIRFTSVDAIDKATGEFVVSDGTTYASSLAYSGYTSIPVGADEDDTGVISLNSGYSLKLSGVDTIYAYSQKNGAHISSNILVNETTASVYTYGENGFEKDTALSDSLTSYNSSSLRSKEPKGLRSRASVSAELPSNENVAEYGFAIARLDSITSGKISDVIITEEYINEKLVLYGKAFSREEGIHKVFEKNDETEVFTAVLINIPSTKDALTTELIFRPYIKLSDGSYIYGAGFAKSCYDVAVSIYYNHNTDEASKEIAWEIIEVCGDPLDGNIGVDVGGLYE